MGEGQTYIEARDRFDQVALKLCQSWGVAKIIDQLEKAGFAISDDLSRSVVDDDTKLTAEANVLDVKKFDNSVLFPMLPFYSRSRDAPPQVPEGIDEHGTNRPHNPSLKDKDQDGDKA